MLFIMNTSKQLFVFFSKKTLLDSDCSLQLPVEFESGAYKVGEAPVPQWIQDILYEYRAPKAI